MPPQRGDGDNQTRIPSDDHNATTSRARREQWPRRTGPRRAKFVANRAYGIADAGEGGRCARVINTYIYIYLNNCCAART